MHYHYTLYLQHTTLNSRESRLTYTVMAYFYTYHECFEYDVWWSCRPNRIITKILLYSFLQTIEICWSSICPGADILDWTEGLRNTTNISKSLFDNIIWILWCPSCGTQIKTMIDWWVTLWMDWWVDSLGQDRMDGWNGWIHGCTGGWVDGWIDGDG